MYLFKMRHFCWWRLECCHILLGSKIGGFQYYIQYNISSQAYDWIILLSKTSKEANSIQIQQHVPEAHGISPSHEAQSQETDKKAGTEEESRCPCGTAGELVIVYEIKCTLYISIQMNFSFPAPSSSHIWRPPINCVTDIIT